MALAKTTFSVIWNWSLGSNMQIYHFLVCFSYVQWTPGMEKSTQEGILTFVIHLDFRKDKGIGIKHPIKE